MSDQIPADVSGGLSALTASCRAWSGSAPSVTNNPIKSVDMARARELCDLLVRPAHAHTVMFWTACFSVVGLIALIVCGYLVVRGMVKLLRLIFLRLRAGQITS